MFFMIVCSFASTSSALQLSRMLFWLISNALVATPRLEDNHGMPQLPFVSDFSSGYFARSFDKLPKNGDRHPWRVLQDYAAEKKILTQDAVVDGVMVFSRPEKVVKPQQEIETLLAAE